MTLSKLPNYKRCPGDGGSRATGHRLDLRLRSSLVALLHHILPLDQLRRTVDQDVAQLDLTRQRKLPATGNETDATPTNSLHVSYTSSDARSMPELDIVSSSRTHT